MAAQILSLKEIADLMVSERSFVAAQFLRADDSFIWGGLRYRVEIVSMGREGGLVPVVAWDNEGRSTLVSIPVDTMVEVW